jgi:hypothetical protein
MENVNAREEAQNTAAKSILKHIFSIIKTIDDEDDHEDMVKTILKAFFEANKMDKEARKEFQKHHPNEYFGVDIHDIVATALSSHALLVEESDIDEVSPYSVGGEYIMCAWHAFKVIEAASILESHLDFESDFNADSGIDLAQKNAGEI